MQKIVIFRVKRNPKNRRHETRKMSLIKSKQRKDDHGEVFTPDWIVEAMLDLVKDETSRIDSRFLEPACGSGNFIIKILKRKLAAVEMKYGKTDYEKQHYSLLAIMCIYGIELLIDNVEECRENSLGIFAEYLNLSAEDTLSNAAKYVLSQNIVHGDALTMRNNSGGAISFAEWGYLGKGKFQRRDFRFDRLTGASTFNASDSLFADMGMHEIFAPIRTYQPMTISDIAEQNNAKPR